MREAFAAFTVWREQTDSKLHTAMKVAQVLRRTWFWSLKKRIVQWRVIIVVRTKEQTAAWRGTHSYISGIFRLSLQRWRWDTASTMRQQEAYIRALQV